MSGYVYGAAKLRRQRAQHLRSDLRVHRAPATLRPPPPPVPVVPPGRVPAPPPPPLSREAVGRLTPQRLAILAAVAEGLTNRQAAKRLGLSSLTVKSHLAHTAKATGCSTRTEAVLQALRAGLLRPVPHDSAWRPTDRQRDVLEQLALGRCNSDIARHLHLSEDTVKTHLRRIAAVLNTSSRAGIAARALAAGVVR